MCSSCGAPTLRGEKTCRYCGAPVDQHHGTSGHDNPTKAETLSRESALIIATAQEILSIKKEIDSLTFQYPITQHPSIPRKLKRLHERLNSLKKDLGKNG
jgi:hypothetical protein